MAREFLDSLDLKGAFEKAKKIVPPAVEVGVGFEVSTSIGLKALGINFDPSVLTSFSEVLWLDENIIKGINILIKMANDAQIHPTVTLGVLGSIFAGAIIDGSIRLYQASTQKNT